MDPMMEKIIRIARLVGLIGVSAASLLLSACETKIRSSKDAGREPFPTDLYGNETTPEARGDLETEAMDGTDAADDEAAAMKGKGRKQGGKKQKEPDSDLWKVICE
jgi:hypothetical protein